MKWHVFEDYGELSAGLAREVAAQLAAKPDGVLVFPTGNTPLGLFRALVEMRPDVSRAHAVILDEYADLDANDARALTGWLHRELLVPLGFKHVHGLDRGPDAMERRITELGGLDFVILGLGPNGHLGFNEPGSAFDSRTRRVKLAEASIASNAAYWGGDEAKVPREGVTLGLGTIAEARRIVLMVSGPNKARILARSISGPVTTDVPGTFLTTLPQAELFADRASLP